MQTMGAYMKQIPARQMFSLPTNNFIMRISTKIFLWYFKRYLNRKRYTIVLRGRTPKRPSLRGYGGNTKLCNAKRIGVYVNDKFSQQIRENYMDIGARHTLIAINQK